MNTLLPGFFLSSCLPVFLPSFPEMSLTLHALSFLTDLPSLIAYAPLDRSPVTEDDVRMMTFYSTMDPTNADQRKHWMDMTRGLPSTFVRNVLERRGDALRSNTLRIGTDAEYDAFDRRAQIAWEERSVGRAAKSALLFAALPFDLMVLHWSPYTRPEVWRALTSRVPETTLRLVEAVGRKEYVEDERAAVAAERQQEDPRFRSAGRC